ncbi:hypothetical protein PC128_g25208, partial [Phytophthora cactorum]
VLQARLVSVSSVEVVEASTRLATMLEVALVKSVADSEQATNSVSVPEATVLQSVELVRPQTDSWLVQGAQAASVLRVLEWEVQWSQVLVTADLVAADLVTVVL